MENKISIIECPRDAMQGWPHIISTENKIRYLNELLKIGFNTLDCGSLVSPKAIPQMADTAEVLKHIDTSDTRLLVIAANERGAIEAVQFENVSFIGYPFSISETFQQRNANSTIIESFERVKKIQQLCVQNNKKLVVYISMGFGNPYGDIYNDEIVIHWIQKLIQLGIDIVSLADTVGIATSMQITEVMNRIIPLFPSIEIGVHLHSSMANMQNKIEGAYNAGCRRFDGAIKGIGGCPMAGDTLVGNMDTEYMVEYFENKGLITGINMPALRKCSQMAGTIFI